MVNINENGRVVSATLMLGAVVNLTQITGSGMSQNQQLPPDPDFMDETVIFVERVNVLLLSTSHLDQFGF